MSDSDLQHTISLKDFVSRDYFQPKTLFAARKYFSLVLYAASLSSIRLVEKLFGTTLYVASSKQGMHALDKIVRDTLHTLLLHKVIMGWKTYVLRIGAITQTHCEIPAGFVQNQEGKILIAQRTLTAAGVGKDANEATKIALAELAERVATCYWNSKDFEVSSISNLKKNNKSVLAHSYIRELKSEAETEEYDWCSVRDLHTDKPMYINPEFLFITYKDPRRNKHTFVDSSSNGSAVETTREKALAAAINELFERDGFLMYWLNRIAPPKIDPESIGNNFVKTIIKDFESRNFSVHILDCQSEYPIPVLVLVLVDNHSGGVYVQAAAGIDPDKNLIKVFKDVLHWDVDERFVGTSIAYEDLKAISSRKKLWHSGQMRNEIEFFLTGKMQTYQEYVSNLPTKSKKQTEFEYVTAVLKDNNLQTLWYRYEHDLLTDFRLYGVRVLIPELMPIYFYEQYKHRNVPRLFVFAKRMGYTDTVLHINDLNPIPHPFL